MISTSPSNNTQIWIGENPQYHTVWGRASKNGKKRTGRIIPSPFRNIPWSRVCIFSKRHHESVNPTGLNRLCGRGHGGGLHLELAASSHGTGGGSGAMGVPPGCHWLLVGYPVFAGAGQDDSPSAPKQQPAGGASCPAEAGHYAGAGHHPPQYSRGYGCGCGTGRLDGRE